MSNRVPKAEKVKYAYVDVVRKQHERRQLDAFACAECEAVISNLFHCIEPNGVYRGHCTMAPFGQIKSVLTIGKK